MSLAQYQPADLSAPSDAAPLPDLGSALTEILQSFCAEVCTIHVLDFHGLLHLVASHGVPEVKLEKIRTLPVGKGIAGLAVERRQAIEVGNLPAEMPAERLQGSSPGLKRAVALPIFRGDAVIGALGIETPNEKTFSDVEIAALLDAGRSMAARFLAWPYSNPAWS